MGPSHDHRHRCEVDRTGAKAVRRRLAVLLGLALDRNTAADRGHGGRLCRPFQRRQIQPDQRADRPQRAGAYLAYAGPYPGTDLLRRPWPCRLPAGRYARLRLRIRAEDQGRLLDRADPQIPAGSQQSGAGLRAGRCAAWYQGARPRRAEDARQVGRELSVRPHQGRSGEAIRTGAAHCRDRGRPDKTSRCLSRSSGDVLAHWRRDAGIAGGDGAFAWGARLTMEIRLLRILIILAGVMGADGVILAAASAHQGDAAGLAAASSMLLFHATAVLAVVALAEHGVVHAPVGIAAAFGFVIAAALFAGDLTLRQFAGHGLFPMAAPAGGTLLIASWLTLAVAAAWPRRG